MPEGKTLDEVVTGDTYLLPSDTKAIIMKVLAAEDRLKSKKEKAVNDLDDVLELLQKMHAENAQIQYQDVMQKRRLPRLSTPSTLFISRSRRSLVGMFLVRRISRSCSTLTRFVASSTSSSYSSLITPLLNPQVLTS